MEFAVLLLSFASVAAGIVAIYFLFICCLTIPAVQDQVIYLNKVTLTWFQDVNFPEQWGFLHNQVTPFRIATVDGESLHAWHILPLGVYRRHEAGLTVEPAGLAVDMKERLSFRLLRDDPDALLVLYLHGAGGTLGSGWRPPSYRALSAGAPERIHVVAIDYRGFGQSSSNSPPSEDGLLTDALALVNWALHTAGIPPERIVVFGQSLGTAVAASLVRHLAGPHEPIDARADIKSEEPMFFSGTVLVAPFADVQQLTATYRVAGTLPLLGPVARFPWLLAYLNTFIRTRWPTKDKLAEFLRRCESQPAAHYHIRILHAKDDLDVPWTHSEMIFWHAVNASQPLGISYEDLQVEKARTRTVLGEGGWSVTRQTSHGVLSEGILKHGLHDCITSYPVVSSAVLRAFGL